MYMQSPAVSSFSITIPPSSYVTTSEGIREVLAALPDGGSFGVDIETGKLPDYADHPAAGILNHLSYIRLLQIYSPTHHHTFVLDLKPHYTDLHNSKLDERVLTPLWHFFRKSRIVAHNASFELAHLNRLLNEDLDADKVECSLNLFSKICHALSHTPEAIGGKGYSLSSLWYCMTKQSMDKAMQSSDWGAEQLTQEQLYYAALDAYACYTGFVWASNELRALIHRVPVAEQLKEVYRLDRKMADVSAKMTSAGFYVDQSLHSKFVHEWENKFKQSLYKLRDHTSVDFNLNSPKQVSAWLEQVVDEATLAEWPTTASGNLKTDYKTVNIYASHLTAEEDSPLKLFFEYKKYFKLWSTYGLALASRISPVTGRIHTSFTVAETKTGRMSSFEPNLQNYPRDEQYRNCFCAAPGNYLVCADYSQIEVRVAAHLANESNMLQAFADGVDVYSNMAVTIFGGRIEDVTKDIRSIMKVIVLGKLYGLGAATMRNGLLAQGIDRSIDECRDYLKAFDDTHPQMGVWHREILESVERDQFVTTYGGKVRKLPTQIEGFNYYSKALNTPVQGTAAEIIKVAAVRVVNQIREQFLDQGLALINIVHDELILEGTPKHVDSEEAKAMVHREMVTAMQGFFPTATVEGLVNPVVCTKWGEAK